MTTEEFVDLYHPLPQYTISDYIEELDKRIPLETNPIICDCIKQLLGGFLCECMQYSVNMIDALLTYKCNGVNQTFGDMDQIALAQRNLKLYYDDTLYYYHHYYNSKDVFDIANRGRVKDVDFNDFTIDKLLDYEYINKVIKKFTQNQYIMQFLK